MVKHITAVSLPAYLRALPAHLPVPLDGPRYTHHEAWLQTALDVMLAPYNTSYSSKGVEFEMYVRPVALHLVTRKIVSERDRYLDIKALHQLAASDHRISFEDLVIRAAEAGRPLGRPIDLIYPFEEQQILADIVFGRASAPEDVAQTPHLLSRVFNRRWRITDVLAFCPDKEFRRSFLLRFRSQVNRQKAGKNRDPFLAYQGKAIGYEIPGSPDAVFAELIDPETIDADWFEYLLERAQRQPGVLLRIIELAERGCVLPADSLHKLAQAPLNDGPDKDDAYNKLKAFLQTHTAVPVKTNRHAPGVSYAHP